jgi:uncharacterized SAM-binding protein YcdF (DUF218 family)
MKISPVFKWIHRLIFFAGLFFILFVALAFTKVPWNWFKAMANPGRNSPGPPDCIVMMGGGGIPSESGLMRTWKTAEAARLFPDAMIIVALPAEDGEPPGGTMKKELVLRGVAASRIYREPEGRNTREQATKIYSMLNNSATKKIGLVTSPEHMKRTWMSFKKAGFNNLISLPSWPEAIAADVNYNEAELGSGAPSLGGAIGGNLMLKYRLWDNLGVMMRCTRETVAIWYYKLMGWV